MSVFDPRSALYKTPFGAVACGTTVSLHVSAEDLCGCTGCTMICRCDFSGAVSEYAMTPAADGYDVVYTAPEQPELVWYSFRFSLSDGSVRCWAKNGWCSGGEDPYQLTVYESAATPDWFGRGVTYQIFPDRFCRSRIPFSDGLLGQRTVHRCWEDVPAYTADPATGRWCSDFFGGDLRGIIEKLDYLSALSVTTVYLNPIFYAASNHRYDTADYLCIDPMLGTEDELRELCVKAKERGIHIILDGVFNHTGAESRYFNLGGHFSDVGAAQSKDSPYYSWYTFHFWPDQYDGWWNIATLPAVNESDEAYLRYIVTGEDSVIRHYLRCGISGWRLDVADELPDGFIAAIRHVIQEENPDAYLIGEVWEDGSNKIAYSRRRQYLLGRETHGLMNYPFRTAVLDFLRGGDAAAFREAMETLRENYPYDAFYGTMNLLGTHDTPRLLTLLGADIQPQTREERAAFRLSDEQRRLGKRRLFLAAMLQYAFPGSPTVFYGDEAGIEGWEDPLNRRTYPWGGEDGEVLSLYRTLGQLRRENNALQRGSIEFLRAEGSVLVFRRQLGDEVAIAAINAGDSPAPLSLPWGGDIARDGVSGQLFLAHDGAVLPELPPLGGLLLF